MATGTMPNDPTPPPVDANGGGAVDYDGYIEAQLRKTRAQVKVVDIVTGVLVLITGALAYLFVLAIIDHWILPLGFALRVLALMVLAGGAGWWFVVRILPLILHRINPVYAAYTIERAEPTLKNSLINFLLFRGRQAEMREVVYQALGQRAASDLRHVPVDQSVDRSMLIKIGYVLAGVLAVCALYKIISPKDPLQSVARVVVPWADIDRPSRVQIDDVRPGNDVSVFFGDTVTVSARVRGLGRGDEVKLIYSTADGQVIDQHLEMKLDSAGLEHQCTLFPGEEGITQTLQYRIAAGDAETRWFNVEVVPAPTIIVHQVRYEFPRYTGRAEEVVEGTGDVSALEGTKVTLYARANRDIESAYLEFDPIAGEESAHDRGGDAKTFKITKIDGDKAEVSFYLQLKPDRKTQVHSNYWLRFKSADGYRNRHPIVHAIDVKPDLAPLVEILTPTETRVEVPQNGRATVEVRAVDHDFAISKVAVRGIKGTEDLFDVALLESRDGRSGQVVEKFEFAPEKYGLVEGDVVEYWAVAEDNRTAVRTQRPEPNSSRSNPNFRFEIVPPKKDEAAERPEDKPRDDSQPADDQQSSGQGGQPQDGDQQQGGGRSGNEGQPEETDQPQDTGQQLEQDGESGNQGGTSGKQGKPSGQQGESQDGQTGQDGGANGGQNGKPSDGQSPSSDSQGEGNGQSGQQDQSDQQSGADGQKTGQGQRTGKPSDGQSGQGQTEPGQSGQGGEGQEEPVANDGSQDGDAFERIRDHIRQSKDGQKPDGQRQDGQQQSGGNQPQDGKDPRDGGQSDGQSPQDQAQGGSRQQGGSDAAKPGDQSGAQQNSEQGQGSKPGDQQGDNSGGDAQGKQPQGGKDGQGQDGGSSGQKPGDQSGKQPDGSQQGGGGQQDKDQQGKSGGDTDGQQQGGGNDGQKQQDGGQGDKQGGQPQGGQRPDGSKPGGKDGNQQQSGGQGQNDKPGGGKQGDGQGSPMSQAEDQQQQNKPKSGGQQGGKPNDGGKSPGNSKKDSDSQGGSGGDRKGGGEQGGGQSTPQQGQDSAGSSSSGQQGDGASQDPGGDQKGKQGGGDQVADSPTGRSGDQSGEGSRSGDPKSGEQGEDPRDGQAQPGGSSGGRTPGDGSSPQGDPSGESDGSRPGDKPGDGNGSGIPTGGGKPSDNKPTDFSFEEKEPGADEANVEYARKATDMVLDYLKNQKDDPDRELLDKLGWNKDELADFMRRWERMKQTAGRNDAEGNDARRRLDDTLRSLGLRPRTNNVRSDSPEDARLRGQRDSGHQSRPPKEYAEQFRAFSKFIKPND